MAIQATGRATFTAVEDYDIVFVLNGIRCDVLNFDSVRAAENAVLEADFLNGGEPCVVDKAVLCCYDGEGSLLGSPIEVHDTSSAVADGGSLYLSKDCKTITCDIYVGDKKLCGKTLPVIRDGVGVKAVSYKVINNVAANASLNWDSAQSQTTYPTQKPEKGTYCYVMTIVLYTDGTSTNTVSTSYTPNDGVNGTSVKVKSTDVEYAGGDSGTTAPTSEWQPNVPSLAQGKYLWTRTIVTYSDGTKTTSYSVGRIGMDGSKGGTTHILYASSANPQSPNDVVTVIDASHQYYGTYQDTEVNDDNSKYTKVTSWVLIKGDAGKSPQPNLCRYNSLVLKTAKSLSYDLASNTYTIVNNTPNKQSGSQVNLSPITIPYGQRYTASADVYSPVAATIIIDYNNSPVSGSAWGDNDNDDVGGRSANRIEIPANTWTTITWSAINSSSANTNKVDINIWDSIGSSAPADTAWKLRNLKVEFGDMATPWVPNKEDINGTQYRTVEKYAYGTSNKTAPTGVWSDSIDGGTAGQYLWNQETAQHKAATDSHWVDDSVTTHCIGYIAKNGVDGVDGENGANFTGVTEHYKATNDGTNAPKINEGPWHATPTAAEWSADKPYLWNYETITRDKGGSINTNVHLGSVWGKQGIKGNDGHSPTVTIGKNGNWWIDGKDSGQKAQGDAGHTPTVTIGNDGYWYINNVKTSQKAQGEPGAPGADAVSYRLVRMADTAATVKASNSSTNATFALHYTLHYKAAKLIGDRAEDATIATIVATIEGKEVTTTVNGTEGTRRGTGDKSYTSDNRPADSIPVTVTLSDGTVLYDSVPVTMEAGVAIDINKNLATITKTLTDQKGNINTIKNTAETNSQTISTLDGRMSTVEHTAGNISLKVGALGLRNLLMDSEFRCPVERAITRNGKRYREAWNNGPAVSVTDTANGIGVDGVNAVKAFSPSADWYWTVTRWYVPAKPRQAYTASAWRMVPDTGTLASDSRILLQLFACKDDLTRDGSYKADAVFDSPSPGEWARTVATLTMPDDTAHPYIEVTLAAYRCGTVYFRQPQLEYGSEATEWTRCADDVEGGLLATGVDIENGTVKMTGQNFQWQDTRGVRVLYMDDNGNATFKGKVTASAIEGSSVTGGTITGAKIVSENAGDGTRTTIEGGKLTTKGAEMENVTIGAGSVNYGTNRQPFACWDVWNNDTDTSDNLILPAEITQSMYTFPIPWEYECNGRVITLVNYKIAYNNSSHYPIDYSARIVAPSGKFFFEDGIAKGSITVGREIVRIMGYGSSIDYNGTTYKEFYGWVVLSREPIGESLMRGEHQRIIYQGVYDGNLRYKAFNGASLSAKKDADGYFTISFGKPFASVNDYEVIVSARDLSNSTKGYACVISKNTGSFKVVTAYKGAPYNGGFTFQVIPAWDWS